MDLQQSKFKQHPLLHYVTMVTRRPPGPSVGCEFTVFPDVICFSFIHVSVSHNVA